MKQKMLVCILVFGVLVLVCGGAGAEPLAPREGLELLRKALVGIDDFSAAIIQEKHLALMRKTLVSRGEVRFRKPDSFAMELVPPHASTMILKDSVLSMQVPGESVPQRILLPPEQGLRRWFALLARPVHTLPEGFDITAERQGGLISLRLVPRRPGAMKSLSIQFTDNGILKKLVVEENNRDRTSISFLGMKKNRGLTDRDFQVK